MNWKQKQARSEAMLTRMTELSHNIQRMARVLL